MEEIQALDTPWITDALVVEVFNAFKSKKSPGTDNIKPILFKNLNNNYISFLTNYCKAMLILKFTPTIWKEAKLVFIPKPGKDSYKVPKAWRPISLTNYPVKALEKLCVKQADQNIKRNPVHDNQHGFRSDRSTTTANQR